jgi:hypothetical protein
MKNWAGVAWIVLLLVRVAGAQQLPVFDFKDAKLVEEWKRNRHITAMRVGGLGLFINGDDVDPFIIGPARDYPRDQLLWLRMRIRSEKGGMVQVFYYKDGSREENSVKEYLAVGEWEDVRLPLPALGKGYHLRIDPPGGKSILAKVGFETRVLLKEAQWLSPSGPELAGITATMTVGQLQIIHSADHLGEFVVMADGERVAIGGNRALIGYVIDQKQKWIDLRQRGKTKAEGGDFIEARAVFSDEDGGEWKITQIFSPANGNTAIDVRTIVTVNLRDFPQHLLAPYGVEAQSPDTFLLALHDTAPAIMARIIEEQASALWKSAKTPADILANLTGQAPSFAARMRSHF